MSFYHPQLGESKGLPQGRKEKREGRLRSVIKRLLVSPTICSHSQLGPQWLGGPQWHLETMETQVSSTQLLRPATPRSETPRLPLEAGPDGPRLVPSPSGYTQL